MFLCYLHIFGRVTPVHSTYVCACVVGVFLLAELPNAMLFIVMIVDNTWELVILRSLPPAPAVRRQQEARPFSSTSPLIQLQTSKSERKA